MRLKNSKLQNINSVTMITPNAKLLLLIKKFKKLMQSAMRISDKNQMSTFKAGYPLMSNTTEKGMKVINASRLKPEKIDFPKI